MNRTNTLCAILLTILLIPDVGLAQVCPYSNQYTQSSWAIIRNIPPQATAFIGSGCNAVMVGGTNAPTLCTVRVDSTPPSPTVITYEVFSAKWNSEMARTLAPTSAGCRFYCGNAVPTSMGAPTTMAVKPNTCMVKKDGLPVELMEFSVE